MSPRASPSVAAPVEQDTASVADPDTLARAVLACPLVADMSSGVFGEAATYLPGRRVAGVRITDTAVEVHVVAVLGVTVTRIGAEVRDALAPLVGDYPVDVVIEDVVARGDTAGRDDDDPRHRSRHAGAPPPDHAAGAARVRQAAHTFGSTHVQGSTNP